MTTKWGTFIFIPLWVIESLIAQGYTQCDMKPKNQIECRNEWEIALFQYERVEGPPPYETVSVVKLTPKDSHLMGHYPMGSEQRGRTR